MKNKTMMWAVLAVIVLLAVWYLYANPTTVTAPGQQAPSPTTTESSATQKAVGTATKAAQPATQKTIPAKTLGAGTFSDLFNIPEPLICTISAKTAYLNRSGTLYVANRELRGDFSNGVSMIDDGSFLYVWKAGATTGIQLSAAVNASGNMVQANGGLDPTTTFSYACAPWDGNIMTVIALPTFVTFERK